jgi:poly-beta-hydroxyalkanoate depolymerase
MDNLLIDVNKCKKVNLIGDKGYIRSKKDKNEIMKKYNTKVIHPNRKNQKENTTNNHKKLLKDRYVIENVFANLKRFNRICIRRDRLAVTFKGFLFLATLITSNM